MRPAVEIEVRACPRGGWEWYVLTFARGRMNVRAHGRAPYRWMAWVDARRCVRVNLALLLAPPQPTPRWLDDIDLH